MNQASYSLESLVATDLGNSCSFGQKWRDATSIIFYMCFNSTAHYSNAGRKNIHSQALFLLVWPFQVKGFLILSTPSESQVTLWASLRDPENGCQFVPSDRSSLTASGCLIKILDVNDEGQEDVTDEGMLLFRQLGDER